MANVLHLQKKYFVAHVGCSPVGMEPNHVLAQLTMSGSFQDAFYSKARDQLRTLMALLKDVSPEFVAKLAVYAREQGHREDIPAFLCAYLSVADPKLLEMVFPKVMDSDVMVRQFVHIMRSGAVGRFSLGSLPKRLLQEWLASQSDRNVFLAKVGQKPTLADLIKMVHPKPKSKRREALYGYLLGKKVQHRRLPRCVQDYECFKAGELDEVPKLPFDILCRLPLSAEDWKTVARNATWQTLYTNVNTFARYGVFQDMELCEELARRLKEPRLIKKAGVLPYEVLTAYKMAGTQVPASMKQAMLEVLDTSLTHIPKLKGITYICIDVSWSMRATLTETQSAGINDLTCLDVAALLASTLMRGNRQVLVLPFSSEVVPHELAPKATVLQNAEALASISRGRSDCAVPLKKLNKAKARGDTIIYISDHQSWLDTRRANQVGTYMEWLHFKARNPEAKMVCIDLKPYTNSQVPEQKDVHNIAGFSDGVFSSIEQIISGEKQNWVQEIENVALETGAT